MGGLLLETTSARADPKWHVAGDPRSVSLDERGLESTVNSAATAGALSDWFALHQGEDAVVVEAEVEGADARSVTFSVHDASTGEALGYWQNPLAITAPTPIGAVLPLSKPAVRRRLFAGTHDKPSQARIRRIHWRAARRYHSGGTGLESRGGISLAQGAELRINTLANEPFMFKANTQIGGEGLLYIASRGTKVDSGVQMGAMKALVIGALHGPGRFDFTNMEWQGGTIQGGTEVLANRLTLNAIGLDMVISGATLTSNTGAGVFINGGFENVIGSPFVVANGGVGSQNSGSPRQVIAGNAGDGVHIRSDTGAGGAGDNRVEGNLIGTRASGSALPNGGAGVHVDATSGAPAAQNVIGGTAPGAGNQISGNVGHGVFFEGAEARDNRVEGNLIGINPLTTDATSNGGDGVRIDDGRNNIVGGSEAGAGNVVSGSGGNGVFILGSNATGNRVQGNHIGTSSDGSIAIPNVGDGVRILSGRNNLIGGTVAGAGNTISGNEGHGVGIILSVTRDNRVEGNFIGTNADGTAIVPNTRAGVRIESARFNIIGGTVSGAGNVIAGNEEDGVQIVSAATGNRVERNHIGTNAAGVAALANGGAGVRIDGALTNTIGGNSGVARNLISGNGGSGVDIAGAAASGNLLQGDRIGTNLAGDAALPNSGDGVRIDGAPSNTLGGTTVERGNLISGNGGAGVRILNNGATGAALQSNFIGTNAAGTAPLPNASHGVAILNATGGSIGANPGTNVISGNGAPGGPAAHGIFISGGSGHVVKSNRIGTNSTAGFALPNTGDGVHIVDSANNTVGGDLLAGELNHISGNGPTPGNGVDGEGVRIIGAQATGNRVRGNFIGVNFGGSGPLGNSLSGIVVDGAVNTTIGGAGGFTTANVIAANGGNGVEITGGANGTRVAGNRVGTNFANVANLGNAGDGVLISDAPGNIIGGTALGPGG